MTFVDVDTLHDTATVEGATGKRLNRKVVFYLDPATYRVLMNDLVHNPVLNYSGDLDSFMRDAVEARMRELNNYLSRGGKAVIHKIQQMETYLSAERYVIEIKSQIDQAADHLAVWTREKEWESALQSMLQWAHWVDSMEGWAPRIARQFLAHDGIKQLRATWKKDMPPTQRLKVEEVFVHWEELSK